MSAYLLDCNASGTSCSSISHGSANASPWSGSGTWVSRTISFGTVTHALAANRALAVKITVTDQSDDDMWFAYDTSSQASVLTVELAAAARTTTVVATTTTAPAPTTTTTSTTTTTAAASSTTSTSTDASTTSTSTARSEEGDAFGLPAPGTGQSEPPGSGRADETSSDPRDEITDRALQPLSEPSGTGVDGMGGRPGAGLSLFLMEGLELVVPPGGGGGHPLTAAHSGIPDTGNH